MIRHLASSVALAALATPAFVAAQESGDAPPPGALVAAAETGAAKLVYTPADFARFSPKTAYDMLVQIPSFTIRGAEQERGLGQASENVLINSERIANKQGGAIDELRKIPAGNVVRIEIVDAASLGIAGLSGQVANIVLSETGKASGQFEWNPDIRAHYAKPNLFRGNISYSGKSGWLDYNLSVKNQTGRGAFGGPIVITDSLGNVTETREQVLHNESELVTFRASSGSTARGHRKAT
jgi:outer membrane receptor for ferrienterochelin and colicins